MSNLLMFSNRNEFRDWLSKNCLSTNGVWLLFGKANGPVTLSANDALEEALCFGWIDGQMKRIDDRSYKKYFAQRRENSKWSQKNKALSINLEQRGMMSYQGRAKIEEAKKNGQWDVKKSETVTKEQIEEVECILKEFEPAYSNFMAMSPSIKKTYTKAYLDAKTNEGRAKRISWMVNRLNRNLKPM